MNLQSGRCPKQLNFQTEGNATMVTTPYNRRKWSKEPYCHEMMRTETSCTWNGKGFVFTTNLSEFLLQHVPGSEELMPGWAIFEHTQIQKVMRLTSKRLSLLDSSFTKLTHSCNQYSSLTIFINEQMLYITRSWPDKLESERCACTYTDSFSLWQGLL